MTMAPLRLHFCIFNLLLALFLSHIAISFSAKVYVVYLGSRLGEEEEEPDDVLRHDHQMLASVHRGSMEEAKTSHVYSYKHGFRGFAAKLTHHQASLIAEMPGVVSVFPNLKRSLHTTHSWDFMGVGGEETMEIPGFSTKNQVNVIVGFIDTGIWPESPSFSDAGMPPVPARWKGKCQSGEAFNASSCNRKVIGARYYMSGYEAEEDMVQKVSFRSPRDSAGHVASVGNEGNQGSATNLAPWMFSIAASSTDRDFTSDIVLGNSANFTGESLSLFGMNASARVISASEANAGYFTPYQSSYCLESSLNSTKARGKVLVCQHAESSTESKLEKSIVVKEAGGVGMILVDEADKDVAIPFVIPSAIVGKEIGNKILTYINHTSKPISKIFPAKTVLGSQPAPRVAAFSSKGPNALTPEILKPDVSAPGLNILAAWSPADGKMQYNILSGTSMACPHITGIATLIKAVHPSWSPSAIKSAIMTTASIIDKNYKPITVDPKGKRGNAFDYGSGFVDPRRVLNPGLAYDTQPVDYKEFLCSIGYDEKSLHLITRDNSTCNQILTTASDLNYPSITVPDLKDSFSVTRTVTNVGKPRSIYKAVVSPPIGINVTVVPKQLIFNRYGQKMNFTVNFKLTAPAEGYGFGFLSWRYGKLRVTSPLVVRAAPSNMGLMR
ncbi:hypothetical protein QYF36_024314 [Acer negundo]|nr:hypothetical protein QYF36_024314 [Acer negundo]